MKETFLDYNMEMLLDLFDELKTTYNDLGYMNEVTSSQFIQLVMDNVVLSERVNESSSDDEGLLAKKC
jgi:hypothetical protein